MHYDFVAIGDATSDAFIKLKAGVHVEDETTGRELCFNFGDKVEYEQVDILHGVGNSANAAVSASRLGATSALITDLGTDERGDSAITIWQRDGVHTELVRRHPEFPTHYHFVLRYGAERTILIKHQPWPYALPQFSQPPKWIYFSSVGEHGEKYHHDIASYCVTHGIKLAFQPGTFQIELSAQGALKDVYVASELFFCNKEEAQRILRTDVNDMVQLLSAMRAYGPKNVVITDGPRGAYAQNSEGTWQVPMYPDIAPPVDRTGAGDAFASTVTTCLALGMSLPDALLRGPINSMSVVQKVGAQAGLLSKAEIERYLSVAPSEYIIKKIL